MYVGTRRSNRPRVKRTHKHTHTHTHTHTCARTPLPTNLAVIPTGCANRACRPESGAVKAVAVPLLLEHVGLALPLPHQKLRREKQGVPHRTLSSRLLVGNAFLGWKDFSGTKDNKQNTRAKTKSERKEKNRTRKNKKQNTKYRRQRLRAIATAPPPHKIYSKEAASLGSAGEPRRQRVALGVVPFLVVKTDKKQTAPQEHTLYDYFQGA